MNAPVPTGLRVALIGAPNCGKTALFNRLTGGRQKVANYAGVTVEKKEGVLVAPSGQVFRVLDLPGAYSLKAASLDESVTRHVVLGQQSDEEAPDLLVCVVDATNLRLHLRLVVELRALRRPMVVALNMMDVARDRGVVIHLATLEQELGVPVVETVAVKNGGADGLMAFLDAWGRWRAAAPETLPAEWEDPSDEQLSEIQTEVRRIIAVSCDDSGRTPDFGDRIDHVVMHPIFGMLILGAILFFVFQAVFDWAQAPMDVIKNAMALLADEARAHLPPGLARSLLADGVISGAGAVLVFLPQILILFAFILALEDSGYLPRAAFLLDRIMGSVGLSGRAFIPLLSSFACAIPGIMATRTIQNPRDRLVTIMVAPLMTCSARLPVYALLIGAFIPQRQIWGWFNLRGLVLFGLYASGILSAMLVAVVLKRLGGAQHYQPLLLELPPYRLPKPGNLLIGLLERARIFVVRVGTIILTLTVLLWFISSFPAPPEGATEPAIHYSIAGIAGRWMHVVFAPLGFNWQISLALIPGLAAREVVVGALGTVYALSGAHGDVGTALIPMLAAGWTLPTALSLLAWFVFAPQCVATLGVVRRETNSWRYPALMAGYLFSLAYLGSLLTYNVALSWFGA